jgi:alpha-beta hydrolase superfamily lysophospholipase
VKTKQDYFLGVDGARLFYQLYEPDVQAKATVIVVHGHGDHSGGLIRVCEKLTENGYVACALDLRVMGKVKEQEDLSDLGETLEVTCMPFVN